jgi:hypothetical protein
MKYTKYVGKLQKEKWYKRSNKKKLRNRYDNKLDILLKENIHYLNQAL